MIPRLREHSSMTGEQDDAQSTPPVASDEPESKPGGIPLYYWVLGAVALAIPVGFGLGIDAEKAKGLPPIMMTILRGLAIALELAPKLILNALTRLPRPWSSWRS